MRCDVCDTLIPLGQDECPNCGYKIPKKKIGAYDASSITHEHIQSEPVHPKKTRLKQSTLQTPKKIKKGLTIGVIVGIVVSLITSIVPIIFEVVDVFNEPETNYEELTFEEVLNENDNELIAMALEKENQVVQFLEENGYEDIEVTEDSDDFYASFSISSFKNNCHYYIDFSYADVELQSKGMTISGSVEGTTNRTNLLIQESDIKELADYLGIDNAYQTLKDNHGSMKRTEDMLEKYRYSNYDDYKIYMIEEVHGGDEPYLSFYYSLGI